VARVAKARSRASSTRYGLRRVTRDTRSRVTLRFRYAPTGLRDGRSVAHDFHDRSRQRGEVLLADRERRRHIHDRPDRPHERAFGDEPAPHRLDVIDPIELDDPDRTQDADVVNVRSAATWRETALERGRNGLDLCETRLALEQVERRIGAGAGERVRHVG